MTWDGIKQKFEDTRFSNEDGVVYWRERVLKSIFLIIIISGIIPYIFSIYLSLKEDNYTLIILNTFVYFSIVSLYLANTISLYLRIISIIVMAYIIGFALVFMIGPEANGLSYVIAASLLSALLLGLRGAAGSLLLNIVMFAVIALGLHYGFFAGFNISKYTVPVWITVTSSTEIISLLSSVPLAILLNGLEKTINKQKKLQDSLREKVTLLDQAKQRAEEADRLKTNFLANMSHEVRTPLNAIMGFTELLMYDVYNDEDEKNRYLNTIHNSGTYLLNIIKNILDFSVIESGQLKLHKRPFAVSDLMNQLEQMYVITEIAKKEIKIFFDATKDKDIIIDSDIDRIKQVLINLINNAIKNMNSGSINIGYYKEKKNVGFYVKDTGNGIPENLQHSIFRRFIKIEDRNRVKEGTGLGLPISKGIINALGGDIWVESKTGEGATFYFTIPVDKQPG